MTRLKNDTGDWVEGQRDVMAAVTNHFQGIFTSTPPQGLDQCLACVPSLITPELNARLLEEVTPEEIHKAEMRMGKLKAQAQMGWEASSIKPIGPPFKGKFVLRSELSSPQGKFQKTSMRP